MEIRLRKRLVIDVIEEVPGQPDRVVAVGLSRRDATSVSDFLRMNPCTTPAIWEWLFTVERHTNSRPRRT
jgi:hypothetical protein